MSLYIKGGERPRMPRTTTPHPSRETAGAGPNGHCRCNRNSLCLLPGVKCGTYSHYQREVDQTENDAGLHPLSGLWIEDIGRLEKPLRDDFGSANFRLVVEGCLEIPTDVLVVDHRALVLEDHG